MNRVSQIKTRHYDGFGGNFVDSDHLAAAYDTGKPHVFEQLMAQVFTSTDRFTGKPLLGMTLAKGNVMEIEDEIYRWYLQGAEDKVFRQVENLESSNTTPGLNKEPFRIKLDEGWVENPDVLLPEHNDYALEIIEGPIHDGNGYIYVVRLQTDEYGKFLPPEFLEVGREFSKSWTTVAHEMNDRFGTQQYSSAFQLESQVSAFAQKFEVTDKAMRKEGRIGIPLTYRDASGSKKRLESFMSMAEAKMHDELYMSMEYQMWLGEKTTRDGDFDKYVVKTGPGMRQQLRDGWIQYYNGALTEAMLRDYLMDIFFSRVEEQDRKIVAMTGTGGSIAFHDLLASSASSFLTVDSNYIERIGSNPRHLSYGAQFTHYQGLEGLEVTLVKNPLYDSTKFCKRMHPQYKDKPIDSWRMTFMDFGKSEGQDNIQFLKVKDTYRYGYRSGTIGPAGPIQGGDVNQLKAACEFFTEGTGGIWMKDATRGGELIFDAEY